MKRITNAIALALAIFLEGTSIIATAQVSPQPSQQIPDSVVSVVADAMSLPLVPPDQLPFFGTFWEVRSSLPCLTAPLPFPPVDTNTPVYAIGDPIAGGQFLVDATAGQVVSAEAQSGRRASRSMSTASIAQAQVEELQAFVAGLQAKQTEAVLRANGLMDPLPLDDQDGGPLDPMGLDSYAAGTLWLSISQITNGVAPLIVHGTIPEVLYEIWSKQTITDTVWSFEGSVLGAADQDWTPTTVPVGSRTNSLFLRCRSWVSSSGNGIPDWWLLQYGLPLDTDPYSLCSSGDGWTILQAYQNGWNPNLFYTPPPPQNVTAVLDASGTSATLTWTSGGGPVTNYAVFGGFAYDQLVNPATLTFTDSFGSPPYDFVPDWPYVVRAYFANGSYADSQPTRFTAARLNSDITALRGPGGQLYIAVASVPPDLSSVRVHWEAWDDNLAGWVCRSIDINATNFINGTAPLPLNQMAGYWPFGYLQAQCIGANGTAGALAGMWPYPYWSLEVGWDVDGPVLGFADARTHLKENLKFLLASATASEPFSCLSGVWTGISGGPPSWSPLDAYLDFPQIWYGHKPTAGDYEYSGHHTFSPSLNLSFDEELRPVRENCLWRNLAYDSADFDSSGNWTNGVDYERAYPGLRQIYGPKYWFTCTNCNPLPLALDLTNRPDLFARWVPHYEAQQFSNDLAEIGVAVSGTNIYLPSGVRNVYGLPLDSVLAHPVGGLGTYLLNAGGSSVPWYTDSDYFCRFRPPVLETVDYYFTNQTPYFNYQWDLSTETGPAPPLPGSPTFSITNTSPLLITGFGQPITVSGWAKQTIANGYSGKYAYLEQYFDQAYTIDANGNITTNIAGLLSPYGEFFPTQPGPAALITMPDIDPPHQRGTGVVHVIKLQLDVDHNGVMDLSSGSPDNTSQVRPLSMWVNNDYDRGHTVDLTDYEQDDLSSTDSHADSPWNKRHPTPDCEYRDASGNRVIPSERDLEDFARLWVCGMTSNLLSALPPGTTVTLSWGDVGNPNLANPTIDLFQAFESSGGTAYLTNLTTARLQTNASISQYVGRLGPGQSIQLNCSRFPNNWAGDHLIWCGVNNGTGALTLNVSRGGTNILAQTTAYIQLQDIKRMYERWSVGDNGTNNPTSTAYLAQEELTNTTAFRYGPSTSPNTPYILHVHGWNMDRWEKDRFGETMFKRLYWQGFQGRFGVFRWPTLSGFPSVTGQGADLNHFDKSEQQAWKSGAGLRNLLLALDTKYPGQVRLTAHSMGNIVGGEALRTNTTLAAIYVAMQGAVPAGAYDMAAPFRGIPYPYFDGTTELYRYYPTFSPSRPYFYQAAGAGVYIDFYNPLDWALNLWQTDQNLKPDDSLSYSFDFSTGTFYQYKGKPTQRVLTCPTNTYELFAYCVEGQCWALGAQINVGGAFDKTQQLDLNAAFGFGGAHKGHSGQFRATYMDREPFWNSLGNTLGVLP